MTKSQSSSKRRQLAIAALRQAEENRKCKVLTSFYRKVPVDFRPDRLKLDALNRYIALSGH